MVDLAQDRSGGGCPDEGVRIGVVRAQVLADRANELGDAAEGATADALAGDLGEPALDEVEPGGRRRSEVQAVARVRGEPGTHLRDGNPLIPGAVLGS